MHKLAYFAGVLIKNIVESPKSIAPSSYISMSYMKLLYPQ